MRPCVRINGKLSSDSIDDCIHDALADLRMEGFVCTKEEVELMRQAFSGEMTHDEYVASVCHMAGVSCYAK